MTLNIRHSQWHWHPRAAAVSGDRRTTGERVIDGLNRFLGSFNYLVWQTVFVIAWIGVNLCVVTFRWDAYPFILLNLAFSTQAAYAAPIILAAGIRADAKRELVARETHDQTIGSAKKLDEILDMLKGEGA